VERLDLIETLKHLPDQVAAETAGLGEAALRARPGDGQWSIKEIVGHLRDMAEVWHKRIYMTWTLTDPLFPGFDGEESVRANAYQDADLASLIADMRAWRLRTVDVLAHAVDWTRIGQHGTYGRRSLRQWAEFVAAHDAEHLASIRALKASAGAGQPG